MSKPRADVMTTNKTSAKFQKDQPKTAGGVALTKYPIIASSDS